MDLFNIITTIISGLAISYTIEKFVRWILWYRRGEKLQVDLDDATVAKFDKLAHYTNLTRDKVAEVVIIHAMMQAIEKEEKND